jgi:hypothetical protein
VVRTANQTDLIILIRVNRFYRKQFYLSSSLKLRRFKKPESSWRLWLVSSRPINIYSLVPQSLIPLRKGRREKKSESKALRPSGEGLGEGHLRCVSQSRLALTHVSPLYTQVLNSSFSKGFCYKPMQKSPLGRGRGGLVMVRLTNPPHPTGTPPRRGLCVF